MANENPLSPLDIVSDQYNAQLYVTDEVIKGLRIAPKLGFSSITGKSVPWFSREKTSKQMFDENLKMEPVPNEKGDLMMISGSELTPDNRRVETFGYRYVVDKEDLETTPEPFMADIQDLCYGISKAIEIDVATKLKAAATESTATVVGGVWSASTQIPECLRSFKSEYMKRDINGHLDLLFEHADNYDELGNFIVASEGQNNLKEQDNIIDYASIQNTWAANGISEGEVLGWYSGLPPAKVVFRKIPGAYTPITQKPGTEQFPVINMKIIDNDGKGMDPVRDFRFGASWAVPITRPASIFYRKGI